MADRQLKLKRQSSGKRGGPSKSYQSNPTFYLDENFDCPEVKEILQKAGVRYRTYKQDVTPNAGSLDTSFLPKVGKRGWLLITADWHQRTRPREAEDLRRYNVKHFAMPGNLGR